MMMMMMMRRRRRRKERSHAGRRIRGVMKLNCL
jgi:hypothetical protein